jgi:hypothetical protein
VPYQQIGTRGSLSKVADVDTMPPMWLPNLPNLAPNDSFRRSTTSVSSRKALQAFSFLVTEISMGISSISKSPHDKLLVQTSMVPLAVPSLLLKLFLLPETITIFLTRGSAIKFKYHSS